MSRGKWGSCLHVDLLSSHWPPPGVFLRLHKVLNSLRQCRHAGGGLAPARRCVIMVWNVGAVLHAFIGCYAALALTSGRARSDSLCECGLAWF